MHYMKSGHTGCRGRWLKVALLAVAGVAVAGLVVMALWNWLAPALFGWKEIHFLQALGLLLLSRLLFGGFRGRHPVHHDWRTRMLGRWNEMTPEEREKFRAGMGWCGPGPAGPSSGE